MAKERVQRRLAAILATDVVGYSRLMGVDEVGTLARLKTLRRDLIDTKVAEHQGRIVKETGDGLLLEFASVVEAVQCAVEIQEGLAAQTAGEPADRRIELRMGVNLGDIIVDGGDIFGDGVNIAARLEGLSEAGGICVSAAAYQQIKGKVDFEFEDLGEREVKNISEAIRVYRVTPPIGTAATPSVIALARPAVAVLPFANLSGDAEQEYFADGLTEDLITVLSHWRLFPVIARNSVFTYKGQAVRVQQLARELGARYIVEGSVRKVGTRVRITAQLIDADTGHHIWADKFDREIEDVFALQDEITRRIATTVQPELARAEERRAIVKAPRDLNAWDYVQRGLSLLSGAVTAEDAAKARELYGAAIRLDPGYSQAFTALANAYHIEMVLGDPKLQTTALPKLLESAQRAVELDATDARAHLALGIAFLRTQQHELAVPEFRKSIELNPSDPYAYAQLGSVLDFLGESEEAVSVIEVGLKLNPQSPSRYGAVYTIARAHLHSHNYEKAVECAHEALGINPKWRHTYVVLAASLAHIGRGDEARAAFAKGEADHPGFVEGWVEWPLYRLDEQKDMVINGLRKAGWKGDPSQLSSPWKPD